MPIGIEQWERACAGSLAEALLPLDLDVFSAQTTEKP